MPLALRLENERNTICSQSFFSQLESPASACSIYPSTGLKKSEPMTVIFIVSIALFGYMCYVLVKPEQF
jgi:K+-transporting ATPase KdpF subunit